MNEDVISSTAWRGWSEPVGARRWVALAGFLGAVALAAALGVVTSLDAQTVYDSLRKPVFGPPRWLFGPAWSLLYVLIALAGWWTWLRHGFDRAFAAWCVHLGLNALWTPLFFGLGLYGVASVEIVVMWIVLVITTAMFARRRPAAAWLMLPNVLWVAFAGALSISIAILN